eukprot:COSAG04_NODE_22068_length_362_cov_0.479087_1_plen_57_part_10
MYQVGVCGLALNGTGLSPCYLMLRRPLRLLALLLGAELLWGRAAAPAASAAGPASGE